jgi:hypothetical protein
MAAAHPPAYRPRRQQLNLGFQGPHGSVQRRRENRGGKGPKHGDEEGGESEGLRAHLAAAPASAEGRGRGRGGSGDATE